MLEINTQILETISEILRAIRSESGVSLYQAIFDTGIQVGQLESGTFEYSINEIKVLCSYYGVEYETFCDRLSEKLVF